MKFLPNLICIDNDMIRQFFEKSLRSVENDRIKQIKLMQKICKFLENII